MATLTTQSAIECPGRSKRAGARRALAAARPRDYDGAMTSQEADQNTPPPLPPSASAAGLHADEGLAPREFVLLLVQLGLILAVVWEFHLEERHFLLTALAITVAAFAIHAWLPARHRLSWFCLFSIGCFVLRAGTLPAATGLAIGGGLIAISLLPVGYSVRVLLLTLATAGLVSLREGSHATYWPIVGSMFMFRLIVFMQEQHHRREQASLPKTLAYFFMAPNVFFTLFPVIDYRTFRDGYYSDRRQTIYQAGIHWIATGVVHLLLYRIVKTFLLPTPLDIRTVPDLVQFFVMNYSLYLNVSGQFHLICGMLHLFGFNLPRTHNNYFLASSFSDIWRRINIYWKDFLTQAVFFPAFFRLRGLGNGRAVVLGVLCVFLATWLAHSWQLFWLLGEFPLRRQDAALWLSVGGLVALSALWDYRRSAAGAADKRSFSLFRAMLTALQTVGVFLCVALFWARWADRDTFRFLLLGDSRLTCTLSQAMALGIWLVAAVALVVLIEFGRERIRGAARSGPAGARPWDPASLPFERSASLHLAALALIVVAGVPQLYAPFGPGPASALAALQTDAQSGAEAFQEMRGYYEHANEGVSQASPFLGNPAQRDDRGGRYTAMTQARRDLLEMELIPGWKGEFAGAALSVNRWGMRDRDRTLAKPPGTFRIALVGSSAVMGYGVGDDQTFANLLEEKLNSPPGASGRHAEVLNFGAGGFAPIHRRLQIERKVLQFRPDLILYFAHQDETVGSLQWLSRAVTGGIDLEDGCLADLVRQAGISNEIPDGIVYLRLNERLQPILSCIYQRIVKDCRAASVDLLCIYLPMPGVDDPRIKPALYMHLARDAGMEVLDLSDWLADVSASAVSLDSDHHPNPEGHRLIAERLFQALSARLEIPLSKNR